MSTYRLRVDVTFTTVNNANNAATAIENALTNRGYTGLTPSGAPALDWVTVAGATVTVILYVAEDVAVALRDDLTAAWGSRPRVSGTVSLERVGYQ